MSRNNRISTKYFRFSKPKEQRLFSHMNVKPIINPKFTNFCFNITGISQDKIDNGQTLDKVIEITTFFLDETGIFKLKFFLVLENRFLGTYLCEQVKFRKYTRII